MIAELGFRLVLITAVSGFGYLVIDGLRTGTMFGLHIYASRAQQAPLFWVIAIGNTVFALVALIALIVL